MRGRLIAVFAALAMSGVPALAQDSFGQMPNPVVPGGGGAAPPMGGFPGMQPQPPQMPPMGGMQAQGDFGGIVAPQPGFGGGMATPQPGFGGGAAPQQPGFGGGPAPQPQQPGFGGGAPQQPDAGGQAAQMAMMVQQLQQMAPIELQDHGVQPTQQLHAGAMHGPTPTSIPGGRVTTTAELFQLVMSGQPYALFDVLGGNQMLPGAIPAVNAAQPGSFNDQTQQGFGQFLQQLTGGNQDAALVFYCASSQCWMSYNAALRAINLGYRNVLWYRGGIEAWSYAGLPMMSPGGGMMGGGMPQQGG